MFHTVAGTIVRRKVKQKRVAVELWRPPHAEFGTNNLFDILDESRSAAALIAARMNDDMICLSIDHEIIHGPIGSDLRRIVDEDFVVRILPILLIGAHSPAIDHTPIGWRLNMQFYRIGLVTGNVHKDFTTGVTGVSRIQLRKCSRQVVAKDFICGGDTPISLSLYTPRLIVDFRPRQRTIL